jgi:hypothetical protein
VNYERIQKLAHGLQTLTTNIFLTTMFWARLQLYLSIAIARMKWIMLQLHKEAILLCEEGMTPPETQNALLVLQIFKSTTMMNP